MQRQIYSTFSLAFFKGPPHTTHQANQSKTLGFTHKEKAFFSRLSEASVLESRKKVAFSTNKRIFMEISETIARTTLTYAKDLKVKATI